MSIFLVCIEIFQLEVFQSEERTYGPALHVFVKYSLYFYLTISLKKIFFKCKSSSAIN